MQKVCVYCHRTDMGNRWEFFPVKDVVTDTVCPRCSMFKDECEYSDTCPLFPRGVGCCVKYNPVARQHCKHWQQRYMEEIN